MLSRETIPRDAWQSDQHLDLVAMGWTHFLDNEALMSICDFLLALPFPFVKPLGCSDAVALQRRKVPIEVALSVPQENEAFVKLIGRVEALQEHTAGGRNFRISVPLPKGSQPAVKPGQNLTVSLPFIHARQVRARAMSTQGELKLIVPGQLHDLTSQALEVAVPLKAKGLTRIPFRAIYSPRGLTTQVFVFDGTKVQMVTISPIHFTSDSELLVAGDIPKGAAVVTAGLENLLEGDEAVVIAK